MSDDWRLLSTSAVWLAFVSISHSVRGACIVCKITIIIISSCEVVFESITLFGAVAKPVNGLNIRP